MVEHGITMVGPICKGHNGVETKAKLMALGLTYKNRQIYTNCNGARVGRYLEHLGSYQTLLLQDVGLLWVPFNGKQQQKCFYAEKEFYYNCTFRE